MKVNGIPYRSLWPTADGAVEIIDQRSLPYTFATRVLRSVDDMIDAICTMAVRGAPLIGVAGAYGLALAMRRDAGDLHLTDAHRRLNASRRIARARPYAPATPIRGAPRTAIVQMASITSSTDRSRRVAKVYGRPRWSMTSTAPSAVGQSER